MSDSAHARTWQEIAAQAYKEPDPKKLLELTAELEHTLDERDKIRAPKKPPTSERLPFRST